MKRLRVPRAAECRTALVISLSLVCMGVYVPVRSVPPGTLENDTHDPCPRTPTQTSFQPGNVTEIAVRDPLCRMVFRPTGVRLEAILDGSRPDPGPTVVMDSRGRFYSTNATGFQSVVSVWEPQGEYLTSVGRVGQGPGEFSQRGALTLYVDNENRLHVRDGGPAWSVFSANLGFVRRVAIPTPGLLARDGFSFILDNGQALSSYASGIDRRNYFHLFGAGGGLERSFGPIVTEEANDPTWPVDRLIAYDGGDTFWAGPAADEETGYVVEQWNADGTLRRALRREVGWVLLREDRIPAVGVVQFHADDSAGLLYILLNRLTSEGIDMMKKNGRIPREERDRLAEIVIEVVDTRAGELLASEVYTVTEAREIVPSRLFRGAMQGYRYGESEAGLPFVEILAVELEAR